MFAKACELLNGDEKNNFIKTYNSSGANKIELVMLAFQKLNLKQHTQTQINKYHDDAIFHLHKIALESENKKELLLFCEQLMVREI